MTLNAMMVKSIAFNGKIKIHKKFLWEKINKEFRMEIGFASNNYSAWKVKISTFFKNQSHFSLLQMKVSSLYKSSNLYLSLN